MIKKTFGAVVLFLLSCVLFADAPTFGHDGRTNFVGYTGTVRRIYVNDGNVILIYFDTVFNTDTAADNGFDVITGQAAGYDISANPEFARYLYATALTAQSLGKRITMQMRGTVHGYVKIDRIWLSEN